MNPRAANEKVGRNRSASIRELGFAFFISLLLYAALAVWSIRGLGLIAPHAMQSAYLAKTLAFGRTPVVADSRLFLLPLPTFLQALLVFIPPVAEGVVAPVALSVLAAAFACALLLRAAQSSGLPLIPRWLLLIGWMFNPIMLVEAVSGSGMMFLILCYMAFFLALSRWLHTRSWLPLVGLGATASLAILTHFNTLLLTLIPLLIVALSALEEKPENPAYAENVFWLVATPLVYTIFIRVFFSTGLFETPLYFLRWDDLFPQPLDLPLAKLSLQSLGGIGPLIVDLLDWVWVVFPLFLPLTALYILVSALRLQVSSTCFIAMAWLPVAFSFLNTSAAPTTPNRFLILIIPAGIFLILFLIRSLRTAHTWAALLLAITLITSNAFTLWTLHTLPPGSEYSAYVNAWLSAAPQTDTTSSTEMAEYIDRQDLFDILAPDTSTAQVAAISGRPDRFITPYDSDYAKILDDLNRFEGYLLVPTESSAQPDDIYQNLQTEKRLQEVSAFGTWQLYAVSPAIQP